MNESEKQFSFTRAALSTGGRAKSNVLSIIVGAVMLVTLGVLVLAFIHNRYMRNPRDPYGKLAALGVKPGITPQQSEEARNLLVREREMWSRFQGMTAQARFEFENQLGRRVSFEGEMSLRQERPPAGSGQPLPERFSMSLRGQQGEWTLTTDGTSQGTLVACEDRDLAESLTNIDMPSVFRLLMFPHDFLLSLYKDDLRPEAALSLQELFQARLEPFLPFNPKSSPHSYVFMVKHSSVEDPVFEFTNRHLSRWRISGMWRTKQDHRFCVEAAALCFEDLINTNNFWYPTTFRVEPLPDPWPFPGASGSLLVLTNIPIGRSPCTNRGHLSIRLNGVVVTAD
jgi:hypothetical protein